MEEKIEEKTASPGYEVMSDVITVEKKVEESLPKGIFVSYRRGQRTQRNNQILVKILGIKNSNEAARFIGKKVIWKNPRGTALGGTIVGVHGRKGVLRASFKKGLPGQAVGSELDIC